ncbi:MAG: tripartite tricarboxylate transporter substrate binding protein [bacterium]
MLVAASLLLTGCSREEGEFPTRSISIVVPWDAGGGTDALARSLADQAQNSFKQAVNVNNRPGGSGTIGHSFGANARPDGYTVTMITYELVTYKPLGLGTVSSDDFRAIMQINEDPAAITVHADSPWKTLEEFLAHAKENPSQVTVGNSGPGSVWHLAALKLEKAADVKFTHIPHNGAKPAVTQLLGNHIDAVSVSPAEVQQYVLAGTLRCLGIMAETRDPALPDVPTLQELGYDLMHGTWRGLAVPKDTPDTIVARLEEGFHAAYSSSEFQQTAKNALLGLKFRDAESFNAFLKLEADSVAELVKDLDLQQ